jgi:purine catabolism regulator
VHPIEHVGGYLAVGTSGLTSDGHGMIGIALNLLSFQAEQAAAVRQVERALRSATGRLLISGLSEEAAGTGVDLPKPPVRVAIVQGLDARQVEDELPRSLCVEESDALVAVIEADGVAHLERLLVGHGRAAVSEAVAMDQVQDAVSQARSLAGALTEPGPVVVTRAEILGASLLAHVDTPAVRAYTSALLEPLRAASAVDLMETLRVFLACDGSWADASAKLEVHRHTLRYRIRRIEDLLGRSLDDTGTRAELWLALQLDN